jgi:oxygen-independent coproporphyrinogen-3 oxidase
MHRTHTAEQVPAAVSALREAGFESLSLDLIYGLPHTLARDWPRDLADALALAPEHLSLYGLTVEPHTPLGRWVDRGTAVPPPDDRYAGEFLAAHASLAAAGYEHYEVSNYARPGHRAAHNSAYWRRAPFIGLGPSAHSGLGALRRWNLREWAAYERALTAGDSAVEGEEALSPGAVALEDLYLGLRTTEGLPLGVVPTARVRAWEEAGWATTGGSRLRLTAEGWLRLDALVGAVAGSGGPWSD